MENEEVTRLLGEPLCNMVQAFADDFVKTNVNMRQSMGVHSTIRRIVVGNCCAWCRNLAGTYDADNPPADIYKRHNHCRCTLIYKSDKGKRENVWKKRDKEKERKARISKIKELEAAENGS